MNPNYPDLILNGILLCINMQLIIAGIIKIFIKEYRQKMIGLFCITTSSLYIYNLYWVYFNENLFFNILIGGNKILFSYPLLYLYFALIKKENQNLKTIFRHVSFPSIISISYLLLKFGFADVFKVNISLIMDTILVVTFVINLFYIIKTTSVLKQLKSILKEGIYKRYRVLFFVFMILPFFIMSFSQFIMYYYLEYHYIFQKYLYSPIDFISKLLLLLFIIIESKRIKKIVFGEKIYNDYNLIENENSITSFIKTFFDQNKVFKESNFNLPESLKKNNIDEKAFRLYLKKEYNTTLNNFINDYRIKEFKELIRRNQNNKYSLDGLANQAGFKSRSTFYRYFKIKEGITPKEFIDSQLNTTLNRSFQK